MKAVKLWILPLCISLMLNLVFFSLMPLMMDKRGNLEKIVDFAQPVNVVRIKQKDTLVRKREKKPTPKKSDPPKELMKKPLKTVQNRKMATTSAHIPFEINPGLPPLPGMPVFSMDKIQVAAPDMNQIFDASKIDNSLTPLANIPPIYPFQAKRRGIQGWVKISFIVNRQGTVDRVEILDADPEKIFNQCVINAVGRWKFSPGMVSGQTVNTRVVTTIRFKLEK